MDRFVNKKIEKHTIYEIYRACRLCGAGGGYKMPIIQSIVNLDGCDVVLRQKIRECVQIEVQQDDKMPPLICELCVDKVNDFYEFLEMCRQTNKRTRLRLGLPPQMMPLGTPDAGDCILGVTEPICVYDEDSNEPLSDKKTKVLKGGKIKKEPEKKEVKIVLTNNLGRESRSKRQPSPPRLRRGGRDKESDNVTLNKLQSKRKKSLSPPPKSILKKGQDKKTENSLPTLSRLKRSRERDTKPELPAKRVKISLKTLPPRQKSSPGLTSPKQESKPSKDAICSICKQRCKTPQFYMYFFII
ncbi:uncharacterized protein [Epargyreus clarus]|uniref:uncharacterized protein isoform X2 n=1 Tax=Epargyreus clarus TaxID=520877 RepID=UPI003C2D96EE